MKRKAQADWSPGSDIRKFFKKTPTKNEASARGAGRSEQRDTRRESMENKGVFSGRETSEKQMKIKHGLQRELIPVVNRLRLPGFYSSDKETSEVEKKRDASDKEDDVDDSRDDGSWKADELSESSDSDEDDFPAARLLAVERGMPVYPLTSEDDYGDGAHPEQSSSAVSKTLRFNLDALLRETKREENLTSLKEEILRDQLGDRIKQQKTDVEDEEEGEEVDIVGEVPLDLPEEDRDKIKNIERMEKLMASRTDMSVPSEIPGEVVFTDGPPRLFKKPKPCFSGSLDAMQKVILHAEEDVIEEIICGNWLHQFYLEEICGSDVASWLFEYMCSQLDSTAVVHCFQALTSWMKLGKKNHHQSGTQWYPQVSTVCRVLSSYGVTLESGLPRHVGEASEVQSFRETVSECFVSLEPESPSVDIPIIALSRLLQIVVLSIQLRPEVYSVEEVMGFLVMFSRCSLDNRIQDLLFDTQMVIAACFDWFPEDVWLRKVGELCNAFAELSSHHRNLLQLASNLPLTNRGIHFQRFFSYKLFCQLHLEVHTLRQHKQYIPIENIEGGMKVCYLIPLVRTLVFKRTSDYHLVHTLMNLLDLCVGNKPPGREETNDFITLHQELWRLQGVIKDRDMDVTRVKTKDLIFRLIDKYDAFISCKGPTQTKIHRFMNLRSTSQ